MGMDPTTWFIAVRRRSDKDASFFVFRDRNFGRVSISSAVGWNHVPEIRMSTICQFLLLSIKNTIDEGLDLDPRECEKGDAYVNASHLVFICLQYGLEF